MNMNGYETKTTFWGDFTIADAFGEKAVRDTCKRAFKEWRDNIEYLTELALVLNWKIWENYGKGDERLMMVYDELYREVSDWAVENLSREDLKYYYKIMD